MHLQQHPAFDVIGLDLAMETHHRDLDDVGRERLHREVDGHALGGAAQLKVRRTQVRDRAPAPGGADDEAFLARLLPHAIEVFAQLRVGGPVLAEKFARHVAGDAQLL